MREFSFTVIVESIAEVTDLVENALFEAGCDDALLYSRDGHVYLDFMREASSQAEAVGSAIGDVEKAGLRASLVEDAETAA
ncbi:MAG: hypothetical protein ACJ8FY_21990 [Gemmataceae bacterium]